MSTEATETIRKEEQNTEFDTERYMILVERPSGKAFKNHSRAERCRILQESTEKHRQEILRWIDNQGLSSQLASMHEATAFNILFCNGTPKLADALRKAPSVIHVAKVGDFTLEVLND